MRDERVGMIVETVQFGSSGSIRIASGSIRSTDSIRASALSPRRCEPSEPFPGAFSSLLRAGGGEGILRSIRGSLVPFESWDKSFEAKRR